MVYYSQIQTNVPKFDLIAEPNIPVNRLHERLSFQVQWIIEFNVTVQIQPDFPQELYTQQTPQVSDKSITHVLNLSINVQNDHRLQ
jgi:hypothetical protein